MNEEISPPSEVKAPSEIKYLPLVLEIIAVEREFYFSKKFSKSERQRKLREILERYES